MIGLTHLVAHKDAGWHLHVRELGSCTQGYIAFDCWAGGLAIEHLGHDLVGRLHRPGEPTTRLASNGKEFTRCCLAKQLLLDLGIVEVKLGSAAHFLV